MLQVIQAALEKSAKNGRLDAARIQGADGDKCWALVAHHALR